MNVQCTAVNGLRLRRVCYVQGELILWGVRVVMCEGGDV